MSKHWPSPTEPIGVRHGADVLRSAFSLTVAIIVTLVIVAVAVAVGWWVVSVLVNPLPYSDPGAMAVAHDGAAASGCGS